MLRENKNFHRFASELKSEFRPYFLEKFSEKSKDNLVVSMKGDASLVTEVDHFVHKLVNILKLKYFGENVSVLSEEDVVHDLVFPCLIVDPIDGTYELAHGIGECAISIAYMHSDLISDPRNCAWIFNPFTGFEIWNNSYGPSNVSFFHHNLLGLVSRREWSNGEFASVHSPPGCVFMPRGSIAFKLGLLAAGSCDFIFSRTPKNIWDIAGGTIITQSRGARLYSRKGVVERFNTIRIDGPLVWSNPNFEAELHSLLENI